jgi:5-methyltetrahydrofolate--homocysteine methyltransferase
LWGYAPDEALDAQALIDEKYIGIRPAPGYPACPEHTVKRELFAILRCEEVGITLTDSYAMAPAASVSGVYFSHPRSEYFNVGPIDKDQLDDLARRSGRARDELERALAPVLALGVAGSGG